MDLIQVSTPLSLYLHLPWCVSKCPYCDFNSHKAGENAPFDRYTNALNVDIENEARRASDRAIASIFIGGGTPSLFTPAQIKSVLDQCRAHFSIISNCEITMEVNPGRVEYGNFSGYLEAGVNRLSIGVWAFTFIITTLVAIIFVAVNTTIFKKEMLDWMAGVEVMFLFYEGFCLMTVVYGN